MKGYHYTECGLDNVWLLSGYDVQDFGSRGQGVSVRRERELWKVLASGIVGQDAPITGQEFRFIRGLLDLTQAAAGRRLGHKDHQTVLRWEKNRHAPVPLAADVLVRGWYLESIGRKPMVTRVSERLAEIAAEVGRAPAADRVLTELSEGRWSPETAPRAMEMA